MPRSPTSRSGRPWSTIRPLGVTNLWAFLGCIHANHRYPWSRLIMQTPDRGAGAPAKPASRNRCRDGACFIRRPVVLLLFSSHINKAAYDITEARMCLQQSRGWRERAERDKNRGRNLWGAGLRNTRLGPALRTAICHGRRTMTDRDDRKALGSANLRRYRKSAMSRLRRCQPTMRGRALWVPGKGRRRRDWRKPLAGTNPKSGATNSCGASSWPDISPSPCGPKSVGVCLASSCTVRPGGVVARTS
ncbi:hypothetical protein BT67DRAFT_240224 [Trichocladium antarcticum]|uniref:Uncharacterized protein n=1 Tax=Trichocladium antarcticum TaxID=1450529 RepID=A0AAN6UBY6_9PEZI|nr:hypothetical protein BT67DRAFT_240224 [Trichocladium antarcticum]